MSELIRKHPTLGIEVSSYGRVNIHATKNSKEHWTLGCINKKGYYTRVNTRNIGIKLLCATGVIE